LTDLSNIKKGRAKTDPAFFDFRISTRHCLPRKKAPEAMLGFVEIKSIRLPIPVCRQAGRAGAKPFPF